jgi:SAM-dependent methyltransferase
MNDLHVNQPVEPPASAVAEFDGYAEKYTDALDNGLSISGERQDFFALKRIELVAASVAKFGQPSKVLDFGCGQGASTPVLLRELGAKSAVGVDVSKGLLGVATKANTDARISYDLITILSPDESFDVAYVNGVFHHIPPGERLEAMKYVFDSLRRGGLFAFWENNPFNPGTRYVMNRIPFDRDAITITIGEASALGRTAGFTRLLVETRFFFPRFLRFLRPLERHLSPSRFGAQYMILFQKPPRLSSSPQSASRT